MIKQLIREMEENINSAQEGWSMPRPAKATAGGWIASAGKAENGSRAIKALEAGNAKRWRAGAATQKEQATASSPTWKPSWNRPAAPGDRLKAQLRALEAKLEEARLKKGSLVARQRAARKQMDRVSDRFQTGLDLDHSFGRMTDKGGRNGSADGGRRPNCTAGIQRNRTGIPENGGQQRGRGRNWRRCEKSLKAKRF